MDAASGFYNAMVSTEEVIYYDESGEPVTADARPLPKLDFDDPWSREVSQRLLS